MYSDFSEGLKVHVVIHQAFAHSIYHRGLIFFFEWIDSQNSINKCEF